MNEWKVDSTSGLARLMFLGFVFASAYTLPILGGDDAGVVGRVVWADLFGLGTVVLTFLILRPRLDLVSLSAICYVASLAPGILLSANLPLTIVEICIHIFLILVFVSGCELIRTHEDLMALFRTLAIATLLAAIVGILENSTSITGLPSLFPGDIRSYRGATFRNSGQAGAFFMIALSILIPLRFGSLARGISVSDRRLFEITILVAALCMIMTVKIGSIIGIIIGGIGFAIYKQKISFIVPVLLVLGLLYSQSSRLAELFPTTAKRIEDKVSTRLDIEKVSSDDGFLAENYSAAFEAFVDNPVCGSGLMGFQGVYSKHEVHSTPMKLLGETGLLGCFGYLVFAFGALKSVARIRMALPDNPYREYMELLLPFIFGCCVSWLYTYHMRKREFWILMIVVVVALKLMDRFEHHRDEHIAETDSLFLGDLHA